jgi:hypothetical protein
MNKYSRKKRNDNFEDFNIWAVFTDLMSNSFVVLCLILFLVLVQFSPNSSFSRKAIDSARTPFLIFDEASGFKFDSGSVELKSDLKEFINVHIGEIENIIKNNPKINVLEIIGHTDGEQVGSSCSKQQRFSLDDYLEDVSIGNLSVLNVCPHSNSDLGLLRALSVVKYLRELQHQQGKLPMLNPLTGFRAYSAAQLTLRSGAFSEKNRQSSSERRRIEFRFTQLGKEASI